MAWPTDRRPSDILTGEGVPQLWATTVLHHTESSLVANLVVNTNWATEIKIGDKVWIPVDAELSGGIVDPTVYTPGNLSTSVLGTAVSITIDTWWEVNVPIDDSSALQTQIPQLMDKLTKNAGYALRKKVDGDVFATLSSLTSTWAGSDGQTFTDDLLLDIMEGLDEADIPPERALVGDPSMVADCRKIDKFMTFDYSANPFRLAGYRGRIEPYDLPVYCTNNLTAATTGNYGAVLHRDAIGVAIQSPIHVKHLPYPHHTIVFNDTIYGIDVLRSTFGAYFYTRAS